MKKIILCFSLLILCSFALQLNGQTPVIDSLETLLEKYEKRDTNRINLLNEIAYTSYRADRNKTFQYASEAKTISEEIGYKKGEAESLRLIGITFAMKSDPLTAKEYFQNALILFEEINYKKGISACLNGLGNINNNLGNYPEALECFEKALSIIEETGDKKAISEYLNKIGLIYSHQGDYPRALEYYQKALNIAKESGNKIIVYYCLQGIGNLNWSQGNYPKALENYQKGLKIVEEIQDKKAISGSLNNIGNIFLIQNEYDQALEYYLKSLEMDQELGDKYGISISMTNVGLVYKYKNNFEKALEYYQKSIEIAEEIGDRYGVSSCLNSIANIYSDQKKYTEALNLFTRSLKIRQEIGYEAGVCESLSELGLIHLKLKNYTKSLEFSQKAILIADKLELLEIQKQLHGLLSEIYAATNDYHEAYNNQKLFKELSDSIFSKENIKEITGLAYKYDFEKEKQEIELNQQKKDAIQVEDAKRQKAVRNSFIAGFLFMVLLAIVILRSFIQKRTANKILAEQKEEIETQAEELKTTNDKLLELDQFKEGMTGMIVHDLKNPLNGIINSPKSYTIEKQLEITKQSGKQMLNMVLNILDVYKYEESQMVVNKSNCSLFELSQLATNEVLFLAEQKSIAINNNIEKGIGIIGDQGIIERIFVNLLSNALKYTPNNGEIILNTKLETQYVKITVSDSGPGIPEDKIHLVFDKFVQINAKKSGSVRSTGLGLTFCKMAVEAHEGEINVQSEPGKGTRFWFTLPLSSQTQIEEKVLITKEKDVLFLSENEKELLKSLAAELGSLLVYESTKIKEILSKINTNNSKSIQNWIDQIENCIFSMNEEKYRKLIDMIS